MSTLFKLSYSTNPSHLKLEKNILDVNKKKMVCNKMLLNNLSCYKKIKINFFIRINSNF